MKRFTGYKKVRLSKYERNKRMINTYEYLRSTGTTHKTAIQKMSQMKYIGMQTASIGAVINKNNN